MHTLVFSFFLFWFSVHIPPVHILRVCTDTGTGTSISAPGTSVGSVHQYRYPTLWQIRYDINTGTGQFGNFGTTSIPVPDTSVGSVRYGYGTVGTGTDFHTGTGNFCKFGTTSIPVPGVPVPYRTPPCINIFSAHARKYIYILVYIYI